MWKFETITKKLGWLYYLVQVDQGMVVKRHVDQIHSSQIPAPVEPPVASAPSPVSLPGQPDLSRLDMSERLSRKPEEAKTMPPPILRRSTRERRPNVRFKDIHSVGDCGGASTDATAPSPLSL